MDLPSLPLLPETVLDLFKYELKQPKQRKSWSQISSSSHISATVVKLKLGKKPDLGQSHSSSDIHVSCKQLGQC